MTEKILKTRCRLIMLFLPIIVITYIISFILPAYAENTTTTTIITEGEARVGENETEIQARQRAWLNAKRKALEEAGVVLVSSTTLGNHEVVEDWVRSVALARIKSRLLSEERFFEDKLIVFRIKLNCTIDKDDIAILNEEIRKLAFENDKKNSQDVPNNAPLTVTDYLLKDGSIYTGTMLNGLPDGRGVKRYKDGGKYEGMFRQGYREGSGTMVWPNGDRHTGNWLRDARSGLGEFTSAKGGKQKGRWLNDIFFGD